ncbi:MAG: aminotransferase class IV, partial [Butyricicoccus sp.]
HKYVEEVGSMNCFFKIDGTVYTAPTVGTVLPGVTRMSCIELLKHWGIPVSEERLPIADVMKASHDGKLEEVFGTGTAAVISPVGELRYEGDVAHINNGEIGEVTHKLYNTLTGIQWGKLPDELGWTVKSTDFDKRQSLFIERTYRATGSIRPTGFCTKSRHADAVCRQTDIQ